MPNLYMNLWDKGNLSKTIKAVFSFLLVMCMAWQNLEGQAIQTINVTAFNDIVDGTTTTIATLNALPGADGKISLREAIIATNNDPTAASVTINLGTGTFVLSIAGNGENAAATGDLDIQAPLVNTKIVFITGAGSLASVIQQTTNDRIFEVSPVNTSGSIIFNLSGLKLTGGNSPTSGGAVLSGGSGDATIIINSIFDLNTAVISGGAVSQSSSLTSHSLTILGCTFTNNTAGGAGGAVNYNGQGTAEISTSVFLSNKTTVTGGDGGAINMTGGGNGGTYTITKSLFDNNQVLNPTGHGGAITNTNGSLAVNYSRFKGNTTINASLGSTVWQNTGSASSFSINDNWWGQNSGPATGDIGGSPLPVATTWLQLRIIPSRAIVCPQGSGNSASQLTADIKGRNTGSPLTTELNGLRLFPVSPVTIFSNPVLGTLSFVSTQFGNGAATATFNAGATGGAAGANATADNQTVTANITIESPPVITPDANAVCAGSTGNVVNGPAGANSYSWSVSAGTGTITSATNTRTITYTAGAGSSVTFSLTITTAAGCTLTNTATITINPLPAAFDVTGGGGYCQGGAGVPVGLSGSQVGVNYQLKLDGAISGSAVAGTGSAISFGSKTAVGTYTVEAANSSTTCANIMNGSAVVSTLPLPAPFTVSGGGAYCPGGTGVSINLSGSETGVSYQLTLANSPVGSPVAGTGSPISFPNQTSAGNYTVAGVNASTNCNRVMNGSATVSSLAPLTQFTVTGGGAYCSGGVGAAINLNGSETSVNYYLIRDGVSSSTPVAGTGSPISFGNQTAQGNYTVQGMRTGDGCTRTMSGNAVVTVIVDCTAPFVNSINRQNPLSAATNSTVLVYRVNFSEGVSNVDISDFALVGSGTAAGTIASVSSSAGSTIDVMVTNATGAGNLRLDLKSASTGIVDNGNNPISGGFISGQVYSIDQMPPFFNPVSIASNHSNSMFAKQGDVVTLSFTANENVGTPAVTIDGNAATVIPGSANSFTATYTMTGTDPEGAVTFTINATDQAGNTAPTVTSTTNGSSVTYDRTAPAVTSITRFNPAGPATNATTLVFRVAFGDIVSGVDINDFVLTAPNASGTIASVSSASGNVIDVTVNNVSGTGSVRLDLKASNTGIVDRASNPISGGYTTGEAYTLGDEGNPSVPTNLNVDYIGRTIVNLDWDDATDNVGVTGYDIYRNGALTYTSTNSNVTANGLAPNTAYTFTVKARDAAGNTSASFSNAVTVTTRYTGLNYRVVQGNFDQLPDFNTLTPVKTGTSPNVDISVRPAGVNDNFGIVWEGYINIATPGIYTFETISDDGSKFYFGTLYNNSATALVDNDGLHGARSRTGTIDIPVAGVYPVAITFFEKFSGESMQVFWSSNTFSRTAIPNSAFTDDSPPAQTDDQNPSVPTNLMVVSTGNNFISLNWDNSTDNIGVAGYDIFRNNVLAYTSTQSEVIAGGLAPNTSYVFKVRARDFANNASGFGNEVTGQTSNAVTGLNYKYYEGSFDALPNFNNLTPVQTGTTPNIDISVRPAARVDQFALLWEGNINITMAGNYIFETISDDGSRLYFNTLYNPNAVPTVENDGLHGPRSRTGAVSNLAAGSYPLTVAYFEKFSGETMEVYWTRPDGVRERIPNSAFSSGNPPPPQTMGLTYKYYQGSFDVLPNFNSLTPVQTGITPNVDIAVRPSTRNDQFAFTWEGYINIPMPGNYVFETISDDGSRLYFNTFYNPSAVPTVDNDGLHGLRSRTGAVNNVAVGSYPISVTYFEKFSGETMEVYWTRPDGVRERIPNSAFTQNPPAQVITRLGLKSRGDTEAPLTNGPVGKVEISNVYPNPFIHSFNVSFHCASPANDVNVGIYDLKGGLIYMHHAGNMAAGKSTVRINIGGKQLPWGMYLVGLQVNGRASKWVRLAKAER